MSPACVNIIFGKSLGMPTQNTPDDEPPRAEAPAHPQRKRQQRKRQQRTRPAHALPCCSPRSPQISSSSHAPEIRSAASRPDAHAVCRSPAPIQMNLQQTWQKHAACTARDLDNLSKEQHSHSQRHAHRFLSHTHLTKKPLQHAETQCSAHILMTCRRNSTPTPSMPIDSSPTRTLQKSPCSTALSMPSACSQESRLASLSEALPQRRLAHTLCSLHPAGAPAAPPCPCPWPPRTHPPQTMHAQDNRGIIAPLLP